MFVTCDNDSYVYMASVGGVVVVGVEDNTNTTTNMTDTTDTTINKVTSNITETAINNNMTTTGNTTTTNKTTNPTNTPANTTTHPFIQLTIPHITTPADTYIHQSDHLIYVLDKYTGAIVSCDLHSIYNSLSTNQIVLNSKHCNLFTYLKAPKPFYSFGVAGGVVYYSHWTNRAVYMHDVASKRESILVGGLTRPTQLLLHQTGNMSGLL